MNPKTDGSGELPDDRGPCGRGWANLVIVSLVAYLFVDALYVGIPGAQRVLFGLIVLLTFFGFLSTLLRTVIDERQLYFVGFLLALLVGGLVGVFSQPVVYPFYVVGDFATVSLLFLFVLFGASSTSALFSRKSLLVLSISALAASLVSSTLGIENGRFDPPSPFLLGVVVGFVLQSRRSLNAALGIAVLVCLAFLAYMSGFRTHVALAIVGAFIASSRLLNSRTVMVLGIALIAVAASNVTTIANLIADQTVITESRFRDLAAGEEDQSVVERALEVRDAWNTARRTWGFHQWILGAGHGASYVPAESFIVRNMTPENRVHNIHVGPMLLLFRYGIVGVLALVALTVVVVRRALSIFFGKHAGNSLEKIVPWILVMYLADFLVRNVIIDPLFAFALAATANAHRTLFDSRFKSEPSSRPASVPGIERAAAS